MMHKTAFIAAWLVLLSGCSAAAQYGPDSPHYRYPGGSRLILNQPLEVPAGYATVRLQFGRTVPFGSVQEQEPHCIFEIDTVRPGPQRVEPGTFAITRVERSISTFAGLPVMPVVRVRAGFGWDDSPTQIFYKTEFRLRSDTHPGVRSLTCQHDQNAAGTGIARHLTLAEIRAALGGIFSLQLP